MRENFRWRLAVTFMGTSFMMLVALASTTQLRAANELAVFSDRVVFEEQAGASATAPLPNLGSIDDAKQPFSVGTLSFSKRSDATALFIGKGEDMKWAEEIEGNAIALSGNEDVNIDLAFPVSSFGFDFFEQRFQRKSDGTLEMASSMRVPEDGFRRSKFAVTLLLRNGGSEDTKIGEFDFERQHEVESFVGVAASGLFDRVQIDEIPGARDTNNEFFGQFLTGTRPASVWMASDGGNWDDAMNWTGGKLPQQRDAVFITRDTRDPILVSGPTEGVLTSLTVDNVTNTTELNLNSGSLTVNDRTVIGSKGRLKLSTDGSLITESLDISRGGALEHTGGSLISGSLIIQSDNRPGGTFKHTGGNLTILDGKFSPHGGDYSVNGAENPILTLDNATFNVGFGEAGTRMSRDLMIGDRESGMLSIKNGGTVSSRDGFVGRFEGSNGEVTVNGPGSMWTNRDLIVGEFGAGTLTINDDGAVESTLVLVGAAGTVNLKGGTLKTTSLDNTRGGTLDHTGGTLTIQASGELLMPPSSGLAINGVDNPTLLLDGASLNLGVAKPSVNDNGDLTIGSDHQGTLTIQNGASVISNDVFVGASGTLNLEGGMFATGSLDNREGGIVNHSDGTLKIQRGILRMPSGTGYSVDGQADGPTLVFDEMGSLNLDLADLTIGDRNTGTLKIENSGSVTARDGFIGRRDGSVGEVTVTGDESTWRITDHLFVGASGTGTLTIENGASVTSTHGFIGEVGTGTVSITGSESNWTNSDDLVLSANGSVNLDAGKLTIRSLNNMTGVFNHTGGKLTVHRGEYKPPDGNYMINGANNPILWLDEATFVLRPAEPETSNGGDLIVGDDEMGILNIENGATVRSKDGFIGRSAGSLGKVTVSGAGSKWTSTGSIFVGGESATSRGTGVLDVEQGGIVAVEGHLTVWGKGTINLNGGLLTTGADDSEPTAGGPSTIMAPLNVIGGTLNAGDATNKAGNEIIATNAILNFTADGMSNDIGLVNMGTLNLTDTTVNGDVDSPAESTINVTGEVVFTGFVSGAPTHNFSSIDSKIIFNGSFSPGDGDPVEVTLGGDVQFGENSNLVLHARGAEQGAFDRLIISGDLLADGLIDVDFDNYEPQAGDVFDFLDFDTERIEGRFDVEQDLDGDLAWDTSVLLSTGVLKVTVPMLEAGDADRDFDFDQFDLVKVQSAAKYLTGQSATWGEGDWNGAPGGSRVEPPLGDGLFNQQDIMAALTAGLYLTGPYAALGTEGKTGDAQTSVIYDASSGELSVDAPAGTELTSINIDSAANVFTGAPAANLGGSFDNDSDGNIFKATFGGSFGSLGFGRVAQTGLSERFLLGDLTVVGSLHGGGALGDVDLIYVPEPGSLFLLLCGGVILIRLVVTRQRSMQ